MVRLLFGLRFGVVMGLFLWEYMGPLVLLDLSVALEWEEHKFL